MAQLMEYAEYLSKEIGPRPAGTEEEQQAALYITEQFQKDAGFSAQIEEFTSSSNIEGISAVPGIVVIVVAILGMIFPVLAIPAFILAAASAVLYTLEAFGHPIVTRALARGASQNVVAKYQPSSDAEKTAHGRSRKIVLIARYDSGKVTPGLVKRIESIKLPVPIGLVCVGGIVLAAILLLLHIFLNSGVPAIVVNVLTIISLIVCAYPVVRSVLYRTAPYNEGANYNASGTAALLEVARRISRGSVSEADLAEQAAAGGVRIHGEAAALESGLVPEGAQIRYEAEQLTPPAELGEYDEEERLLAAKAAIAALTGQPVERKVYGSVASKLVNSRAAEGAQEADAANETAAKVPAETADAHVGQASEARDDYAGAESVAPARPATPFEAVAKPAPQAQPVVEEPVAVAAPVAVSAAAEAEGYKNAPSWFVAAQQNAKKPAGETGPVQRSRYAEAIEAAEREAAAREHERVEQERQQREADLKAREEAARAAIASAAPLSDSAEASAKKEEEPQAVDAAPVADQAAEQAEPVFVPYSEAMGAKADGAPADDEFAASLGETTAFTPVQLQAIDTPERADDAARDAGDAQAQTHEQARVGALPAIDSAAEATPVANEQQPAVPETTNPSRSGMFRRLRADVPSMSGVIRMQEAGQDVSQIPPQPIAPEPVAAPEPAAAPAPESATAPAAEPASEQAPASEAAPKPEAEPVDYDMVPSEFEGYEEEFSEYFAEEDKQGAVEMPKSRAGGLFGRFRRKNKGRERLEETPQEWLDVDEDFDARTVGRERGGWESFRNDSNDDSEKNGSQRRWEGGSYSRVRLGHVDMRSGEGTDEAVEDGPIADEEDRIIADEIEQIYHFRNPLYNTEVWFVALGSEGAAHDGTKAFLAEHADDLRGSMVIEVESLGAGELCVATAEGRIRPVAASSRVKRYTRSATAATGIAPGSVDLTGSDSAASILQAAGYQTMHLLGVEGGRPALKGSPDDILENVDDLLLDDNVNFLMELLKK